ncbi:xanthine dehydrogenase small subunit [Friedmanniella endophytica]|uniref:Xanthine dehydrogenase small subunit n=1 Tax=Microlunatus kandeliicorticis TaxID=1759536 RepID=A0A7W3P6C2_9ACTN|nr:xanthine dehydrogenase small subunit [Microlunatus kandeliicorticis]
MPQESAAAQHGGTGVGSVSVNGRPLGLGPVGGHVTLLDWLRSRGLTGTKEGCAEGECGACSVLVARPDGDDRTRWTAINSCLVPAAGCAGQEVITAEGLGTVDALHPVQREMAVRGGSQCGYCTPGFVCSMAAEYYRPERAADQHATAGHDHEHGPNGFDLHALSGNLCRCTGYRPIRDAAYALDRPADDDPLHQRTRRPAPPAAPVTVTGDQGDFVRPADLAAALRLIAERPDARVVAGSTDWGVELNLRHRRAPLTVAVDRLPELRACTADDETIDLGAALTLSEIERRLDGSVPLLAELFPQFASRLIRNGATLGGNLGTGSPIGDSPPVLLALEARLVLASATGTREVALADYFTGYRQSVRRPDELITTVRIPRPLAAHTAFHKIAKRRFDDISSVAVAFALDLDGDRVARIRIGLGGVAATPLRARATEEQLTGAPWTREAVRAAADRLATEGTPLDDHRASAAYRTAMLRTALLKFFARTRGEVSA